MKRTYKYTLAFLICFFYFGFGQNQTETIHFQKGKDGIVFYAFQPNESIYDVYPYQREVKELRKNFPDMDFVLLEKPTKFVYFDNAANNFDTIYFDDQMKGRDGALIIEATDGYIATDSGSSFWSESICKKKGIECKSSYREEFQRQIKTINKNLEKENFTTQSTVIMNRFIFDLIYNTLGIQEFNGIVEMNLKDIKRIDLESFKENEKDSETTKFILFNNTGKPYHFYNGSRTYLASYEDNILRQLKGFKEQNFTYQDNRIIIKDKFTNLPDVYILEDKLFVNDQELYKNLIVPTEITVLKNGNCTVKNLGDHIFPWVENCYSNTQLKLPLERTFYNHSIYNKGAYYKANIYKEKGKNIYHYQQKSDLDTSLEYKVELEFDEDNYLISITKKYKNIETPTKRFVLNYTLHDSF